MTIELPVQKHQVNEHCWESAGVPDWYTAAFVDNRIIHSVSEKCERLIFVYGDSRIYCARMGDTIIYDGVDLAVMHAAPMVITCPDCGLPKGPYTPPPVWVDLCYCANNDDH